MKRTAHVVAGLTFLLLSLIPFCLAQSDNSLADAARAMRKDKSSAATTRVIDNDSLPKEEHISVVGQPLALSGPETSAVKETSRDSESDQQQQDAEAKKDEKPKLTIDPDQSAGDRDKVYDEWRKKVADQKDTITLLQRELDVLQREYRLRAAAMYADAGNRLRNQSSWDKEDQDYKDKTQAKQKDLDRAKQQLSDMQDQARKGGIPAGVVE